MSWNSGMRPFEITGRPTTVHATPSGLRAMKMAGVVQPMLVLALKIAQNSFRLGIHCTSRCQGQRAGAGRSSGSGSDQCLPSLERRSSTWVDDAPQPEGPEFTAHMYHSDALFR